MAKTQIEWTEETWNPVTGCTRASAGCDNCYAYTMTKRLEAMGQEKYSGLVGKGHFNGVVKLHPDALDIPIRRKKPTKYFVNSMSDLFHKDVPFDFVDQVFAVMALCPQHTFQILTKRPERMAEYMNTPMRLEEIYAQWYSVAETAPCAEAWPLPNVWLGTSVEDQSAADERIPYLLRTPAAVRFLSCEPLIGPVNLRAFMRPSPGWKRDIDWIIVGGESGPNARPMHPQWARDLRDHCLAAGTRFFFKQWGHWWPTPHNTPTANTSSILSHGQWFVPWGKKNSGRSLDGVTWNEWPAVEVVR